jgi:hypothetical protein
MVIHSPLCEAIRLGNDIDYLLKKPDVRKRVSFLCPKCRNPPLKVAVLANRPRSIVMLLNHIDPEKYLWHINVITLEVIQSPPKDISGYVDMLAMMRLKVGPERLKQILNVETDNDYPALVYLSCIQIPRSDIPNQIATCFAAQVLLKNGADVNGCSDTKTTCLHMACLSNNPALVDLYLECGANVNALNSEGLTPLDSSLLTSFLITKPTLLSEITGVSTIFMHEKIAPLVIQAGGVRGASLQQSKKKKVRRQKLADPPKRKKKDVRKMFCSTCGYMLNPPFKKCSTCAC